MLDQFSKSDSPVVREEPELSEFSGDQELSGAIDSWCTNHVRITENSPNHHSIQRCLALGERVSKRQL